MNVLLGAFWIGGTLVSFLLCRTLYLRLGYTWLNPTLCATVAAASLLLLTGYPRDAFKAETFPLVWLLGPAVVAMARPIWLKRELIALNWRMFGGVVVASLLVSVITLLLLPQLLGPEVARALSVKSVTTPVALGIAQQTGLLPDFVVVGVMTSGMFGMVCGPTLLAVGGLKGDQPEIGAALGCASHGFGTARSYEIGPTAGAFASVSMALSALAYGLLLPVLLRVF